MPFITPNLYLRLYALIWAYMVAVARSKPPTSKLRLQSG